MKETSPGEFARRLSLRTWERASPRYAERATVARKVARARASAGLNYPPADLHGFAKALGIGAIREVPLSVQGRLVREQTAIAVEIREDMSRPMKTLTLAHEMGHLIVDEKLAAACRLTDFMNTRSPDAREYSKVEELCDFAAEEILLPESWLGHQVDATAPPDLGLGEKLSETSGLEISLVARRLIDLGFWRARLFWFLRLGAELTLATTYPAETALSYREVRPVPADSFPWDVLGRDTVTRGRLRLEAPDQVHNFDAQAKRIDPERVLVMAVFSG